MKKYLLALAALVFAHGPFSVARSADEPAWLTEARAREGKLIKPVTIKSSDGAFQAQVPAKLTSGKIEKGESGYYLAFDIGSSSPLECILDPDGIDMASTLGSVDKTLFPEFEKHQGKIDRKIVQSTDAGAIAGNPFLSVKWLYSADDGKGKRVGGLNHLAASTRAFGIHCFNSDLGFEKTFRQVITALLESLRVKDIGSKPYYSEIAIAELRGKRIGVTSTVMIRDKDQDTELTTTTAMVSMTADGLLRGRDIYSIAWLAQDGALINAAHITSDNGEIDGNLKLRRDDDEQWQVTGTFKQKPIDAKLPAAATPESAIEQTHKLRKYFADGAPEGTKFDSTRWLPSADPTRFVSVVTTIGKTVGDRIDVHENESGVDIDYVAEKPTANFVSGVMEMGPTSMEITRIFVQGSY